MSVGELDHKGDKPGPSPFPQGDPFKHMHLPLPDNVAEPEEGQAPPGPPVGQGPEQPRAIRGRMWAMPQPSGPAQEAPRAPRAIRGRALPRAIRGRGPEQ